MVLYALRRTGKSDNMIYLEMNRRDHLKCCCIFVLLSQVLPNHFLSLISEDTLNSAWVHMCIVCTYVFVCMSVPKKNHPLFSFLLSQVLSLHGTYQLAQNGCSVRSNIHVSLPLLLAGIRIYHKTLSYALQELNSDPHTYATRCFPTKLFSQPLKGYIYTMTSLLIGNSGRVRCQMGLT